MGAGDAMILVIVVILLIVSGLKKLVERAEEEGRPGPDGEEGYEASTDQIRSFLESLQAPPRRVPATPEEPPVQVAAAPEAPPVQVAVEPEEAPGREPALGAALPSMERRRVELPSTLGEQEATPARRVALPSEEAGERPRRTALRRRRVPRQVAQPSQKAPSSLRSVNLRHAVIWSEILGTPLSLRRKGGRRGPASR